mgnify:CR=1 FL=1
MLKYVALTQALLSIILQPMYYICCLVQQRATTRPPRFGKPADAVATYLARKLINAGTAIPILLFQFFPKFPPFYLLLNWQEKARCFLHDNLAVTS